MDRLRKPSLYYIGAAVLALVASTAHASLRERPGEGSTARVRVAPSAAHILSQAYQLPGLRELMDNLKQDIPIEEVQRRIRDVLQGNLPPEVESALYEGPDKIDSMIAQAEQYLPSAQWEALKNKVLALPVVTIPNEVYGAMLAGSAARHFVLAFAEFPAVNAYELNRGQEVTRVMIWQLKNKQGFNMSVGNLLDVADWAAGQLGGLSNLGRAGKTIAQAQDKISAIEKKLKDLESQIVDPVKQVSAEYRAHVDALKENLLDLQNFLTTPLNEWVAGVEAGLVEGSEQIKDLLQKQFGIDDKVLGKNEWVDRAQGLLPNPEIKSEEKIPAQNPDENGDYDPVLLHNGEFTHPVVDVTIPGRGLDFLFKRIYRSRSSFMGRLGWNWTHNFEEALQTWESPEGLGITWVDSQGRKFFFKARAEKPGEFEAPSGVFAKLRMIGRGETKSFELKEHGGYTTRFDRHGFLQEKCDRFGNCLKCERDASGLLLSIVDTVGRRMGFLYDRVGRITALTDNSGRTWKYSYDGHGDLTEVVSPATDLFPKGIATKYYYDDHRMMQIRDPKGCVFLKNVYGTRGFASGQIIAQSYGAPGNIVKSRYVLLKPAWVVKNWKDTMNIAIDRVDLRDRRGVIKRFWHNANGNLLYHDIIDAKGRVHPGMRYRYNADGMRVQELWPSGLVQEVTYYGGENRLMQGLAVHEVEIPLLCKEGTAKPGEVECAKGRKREYRYDGRYGDLIYRVLPNGLVNEWEYDGRGALVVTSASTPSDSPLQRGRIATHYRSNNFGQNVSVTDPRGTVTEYAYDGADQTSVVRDARGLKNRTHYAYDPVGNITAITLPNLGVRKFDVDAQNLIRREATPLGYERRYDYDAHGNVTAMHVGEYVYRFDYDILDRLILRQEPVDAGRSAITRYGYDGDGQLSAVTFPEGNRMRMTYDAWGNRTVIERGADSRDASFTQYQYDGDGNVVGEVDGLGNLLELERNAFGEVIAVRYPNQTREEIERNAAGRVIGTTWKDAADRILVSSKIERDALGLLERELHWDSQNNSWRETQRQFDPVGNRVSLVTPNGAQFRWQYDALGSVLRAQYPTGLSETWTYNALGQPITYYDVAKSKTQFSYDLQGRLTQRSDPNGAVTQYAYDERDNVLDEILPEGASVHYSYDGLGRRTEVAWGEHVTRYDWDGNGRLRALTDPLGRATRYNYDALDRLISETYPDGGVEKVDHDANGQVIQRCRPNGSCVTQKFDGMGNIAAQSARGIHNQFQYDSLGRLVAAQSGESVSQFVYSSLSEVVGASQGAHHVQATYDANGLRRHMEFSDGNVIDWQRDALGRITQADGSNGFRVSQSWGAHGPEKISYGNGRSDTFAYDAMGNVVSVATSAHDEADSLTGGAEWGPHFRQQTEPRAQIGHVGAEGDADKWGDSVTGPVRESKRGVLAGPADHYSYNLLGNLILENDTHYSYDPWQQLVQAGVEQWRYNLNGERVQAATLQFDKNGNMLSDGQQHYIYDALDRLQEVQDIAGRTIARYTYDALNRRVAKIVAGLTTTYIYDGWEPVEIYEDGKLSQQFVRGDALDDALGILGPYYFHKDRLGSVVAIRDASGNLVEESNYGPFGIAETPRANSPTGPVRGFTGQLYDAETGLYYMRNRYYSPKLGQFLSRDPIGYKNEFHVSSSLIQPFSFSFHKYLGATPRASQANHVDGLLIDSDLYIPTIYPQNDRFVETNLHMYVGNNPLNFIDPMGLYWEYSQSSGRMTYVENQTGIRTHIDTGYAGRNEGRNNPNMQHEQGVGPIPRGTYTIGAAQRRRMGPNTMRLTPNEGTTMYSRSGFLIHADNRRHNYSASHGCIIMPPNTRLQIAGSRDRELRVVQ